MKLIHINVEECPICKERNVVNENLETDTNGKIRIHTNRTRWEHRTFACGQKVSFIPNFNETRLDGYSTCKNNPELIEKENKRKVAKESINDFVETLNVDEEFKRKILSNIKHL